MVYARWQGTITDSAGTVAPSASVAVVSETTGALAVLYSDRAGTTPISNPTVADSQGFVGFYCAGDAYKITATSGLTSRVFRYVGIGTASEEDKQLVTIAEATFSNSPFVAVSGCDNYTRMEIELDGVTPTVDGEDLTCLVSTDNGATYLAGTLNLYTLDRATAATAALSGSTGTTSLLLAVDLGNNTGEFYTGTVTLLGHTNASVYKNVVSVGAQYDNAPVQRVADMRGVVKTGGAITNIAFLMTSGNINMSIKVKGQI